MTPIGVLAAICLFAQFDDWRSRKNIAFIVCLLIALIPFRGLEQLQHLRYSTLSAIPKNNSSHIWNDLIQIIEEKGRVNLLTDPVTGYVLSGMTRANHSHSKFLETDEGNINKASYNSNSFYDYAREGEWLFIVNLRNGANNKNGQISGHWPLTVMKVSDYYSDELLSWLNIERPTSIDLEGKERQSLKASYPPHFQLIWEHDHIKVFSLNTFSLGKT